MLSIIIIGVAVAVILRIINAKLTPRTNTKNFAMFAISSLMFSCLGAVIIYQMQPMFLVPSILIIVFWSLIGGLYVGFKQQIINIFKRGEVALN